MRRLLGAAASSLRASPLRTVLTTLGITIGVSAVIEILAFGEGCHRLVLRSFEDFGTNRLFVMGASRTASGVRAGADAVNALDATDGDAIREGCPAVAALSEMKVDFGPVVHGGRNWSTTVWGTSADFPSVRDWPLRRGHFFGDYEVRRALKVCMLGHTPARMLFGDEDPVGRVVRIKRVPFRVIGVLAKKGPSMWVPDQDDVIVVPHVTLMKKLLGSSHFSWIQVKARTPEAVEPARREIRALLRQRHGLPPDAADDFSIHTQDELLGIVNRQKTAILGALLAVALLALLAGGVGIMNIMLVSVMERIREIGLRRAVGARSSDILAQFLAESLLIGLLGGLIGVGSGVVVSCAASRVLHWPIVLAPAPALIAFVFSGLVGVLFGFLPAWRASRLDPIEALRR